MKFSNHTAVAIVIGACIGILAAEILLRPPIINHIFTADIMLILAILLGKLVGEAEYEAKH